MGQRQREAHAAEVDGFVVVERLDRRLVADTRAQQALARPYGEIRLAAGASVIGVRVRDYRATDGAPGIDVEVAAHTVEAVVSEFEDYFSIDALHWH